MTDVRSDDQTGIPASGPAERLRAVVAAAREPEAAPNHDVGLWIGVAAGAPIVAYGIEGVIDHLPGVQLTSWLTFFVGGAIIHDLLLAPLVCVLGWLTRRWVPPVAKAPVQAALVATGVFVVLSWPFVRGYGVTEGEPSFLSRNYATSLQVCIAGVWLLAAAATGVRVWRRPSRCAGPDERAPMSEPQFTGPSRAPSTHPTATEPPG